jgi:two-component system, OmpR family, response regulator
MSEHLRILLVEDNRLLRWWMNLCLSREGFLVVAPPTVDEAICLGAAYPFDVLVSDWRLADGHDGLEILAAVKQASPHIASILISAEADHELTERALGAGFDRVMQKPLEASAIVSAIQACAA